MIETLRRVLSSALGVGQGHPVRELPKPGQSRLPKPGQSRPPQPGQSRPPRPRTQRRRGGPDVDRRIDDARRRLKATIPPPED